MRVSVSMMDKGYREDAIWFEVYFNGELHERCITADEKIGEIVAYKVDEAGKVVIEGDNCVFETLKGEVVIKDVRNEN